MAKKREEVFNVELANLIEESGLSADPETIHSGSGSGTALPDVLVDVLGLRVGIEAKFEGTPNAAAKVVDQVNDRLDSNLCEVGVALLYPDEIKDAARPKVSLRKAELRARFYSPGKEGREWHTFQGVKELTDALRRARDELVTDDLVASSAEEMRASIESFVRALDSQPARKESLFGVVTAAGATHATTIDEQSKQAAVAISGLVVLTAMLLQNELARFDPAVPALPNPSEGKRRDALIASWRKILKHDYEAVFRIAVEVLDNVLDSDQLDKSLGISLRTAQEIGTKGVLGRHDLVGRVYHTLLADKKFLATYYTSIGAAVMLSELALDPEAWPDVKLDDAPSKLSLKVGDLACGTGTLLAASMTTLRSNHSLARAAAGKSVDAAALSKRMIEDLFHGYDVLAYAVQVCATAMLLGAPATQVTRTRLYQVPFGGAEGYLGSADFLDQSISDLRLFGGQELMAVSEGESATADETELPVLDLVIMNPPFTRSVGGSQLLGSLSGAPFDAARKRLKDLVHRPEVRANMTAGLGSLFIELAARSTRPGGRLALVLPKAVLTGESWAESRQILTDDFEVEWVITSHEYGQHNFSDSTSLSEALLIARRLEEGQKPACETTWVNLSENPDNAIEALATVGALRRLPAGKGPFELRVDETRIESVVGEVTRRPCPKDDSPWRQSVFMRSSLNDAANSVLDNKPVKLPRVAKKVELSMVSLGDVATIGRDVRDVHDAFAETNTACGYPAFWGHASAEIKCLRQATNKELKPRTAPASGRSKILSPDEVWKGAGALMVAERLRLNTHRCAAVVVDNRALSNTWWSVNLDETQSPAVVAMWLNSTLGLTTLLGLAEETEGAWIKIKKNKVVGLPIPDLAAMPAAARKKLEKAWESVSTADLLPIARAANDPTRALIDQKVGEALGIPLEGLEAMRSLFGAEPRLDEASGSLARKRAAKALLEGEAEQTVPLF